MSQDFYEVYVAYDKQGNPLYVGQGAKGRHKHCTSGKSHNKLLNKFYFTHEDVVQYVVHCIFPNVSYCLDCFTVDKVDVCTLFKTV